MHTFFALGKASRVPPSVLNAPREKSCAAFVDNHDTGLERHIVTPLAASNKLISRRQTKLVCFWPFASYLELMELNGLDLFGFMKPRLRLCEELEMVFNYNTLLAAS